VCGSRRLIATGREQARARKGKSERGRERKRERERERGREKGGNKDGARWSKVTGSVNLHTATKLFKEDRPFADRRVLVRRPRQPTDLAGRIIRSVSSILGDNRRRRDSGRDCYFPIGRLVELAELSPDSLPFGEPTFPIVPPHSR